MLVNNFLESSAARLPGKTALVVREGRFTYGEINNFADCLAKSLCSEGFKKGDRAVVFLDNSLEAVISIFGILKAGGVFLTINPATKAEKLAYIVNNCRATALVGSARRLDVISDALRNSPSVRLMYMAGDKNAAYAGKTISLEEIMNSRAGGPIKPPSIDCDLATIIYTSGSTGAPKGVMLTHNNMASAADSITEYLENREDDIIINTLPMSFDYGLYQVLMGFKTGGTVILEKAFLYPYKVIETILKEKVTGFPIVPTMSAILLQMEDIKRHSFEHLRYITNTAQALPVRHIKGLREFFPKARLYSMYGLTECKRVSYLPPEELDRRPGSVGKGMPNTEAYIVDEDGKRVGPGVMGELVVRGSNIMKGYWEMPEETAKRIRPGAFAGDRVLYTGDLFRMDEEGFLYFVSRKDDIIKSRGEKVSPKEIENVLYSIEGVVEAAVVGVPDELFGQAIKAFIVRENGSAITEKDIQRHCAAHLEDFLVPKFVEFASELPKTDTGKIKKSALISA